MEITWYSWGVFVGVFLAAAATIYVFFDAQDSPDPRVTNMARAMAAMGLLLTLPSLYVRMTTLNAVDQAMLNLPLLLGLNPNAQTFAYAGVLGVLIALGAAVYHYTQRQGSYVVPPTGSTQYASPPMPTPYPAPPTAPPPSAPAPRPADPTKLINQDPPPSAWFVARSGNRAGAQYGLSTNKQNILGRDATRADMVVDDDTVSREHARVRYENGQFVLYDLASTSGTFINGNRIQRQMLYDNDRVSLGRMEFVFKRA
jgi:hypothetical protein